VRTFRALRIHSRPDGGSSVAGILLLVLATSPLAEAQVRVVRRDDDRLRGIRRVDVLVRDLAADAECGLDRRTLQDTAVEALEATGLRAAVSAAAPSWFYTVDIEARALQVGDQCVSSVTADLVAHVDGSPDADRGLPGNAWGSLLVGAMRLVHESALMAAPRGQHAARVAGELRARVTAIGERVRQANPK
jgi:hypothetical protein